MKNCRAVANLPAPDLPVSEDSSEGITIQSVHSCDTGISISGQTMSKEILFFLVQEFGIFWPIGDHKERNNSNSDCRKAFDDEDPDN